MLYACADLHLRLTPPRVFKGSQVEWLKYQRDAMEFIFSRIGKDDDLAIVGDIFHRAVNPQELTNMFLDSIKKCKGTVYIMNGNHELLNRNMSKECSYYTLQTIEDHRIKDLSTKYKGTIPFGEEIVDKGEEIVFLHQDIWQNKGTMPPNCTGMFASDVIKMLPSAKIIIAGDIHTGYDTKNFHMCGCVTIQTVKFMDYNCSFIKVNDDFTIERIFLPKVDFFTEDYYISDSDDSSEKLIKKLSNTEIEGLDFIANLEKVFIKSKEEVVKKIRKWGNI